MTNKIIAVQGNNLSKLNPITDTSIFLASRGEKLGYKIFYYDPKNLSIINNKVIAKGDYIKINYCLLYTSPSPRDTERSRMPSSA